MYAVLTSGGDAPGMNAALDAIARVAAAQSVPVIGFEEGYRGLLEGAHRPLEVRALSEAARRGGTWLGSARSKEFATPEGLARGKETLQRLGVKGLIVIGGNGSLAGARALAGMIADCKIAGIPASIDNDVGGTSMAIGVDTALNTIVEACDRICDTASAHKRAFIVEVMGRDSGYLAMTAAIGANADAVLIREAGDDDDTLVGKVVDTIEAAYARDAGKRRVLIIKAEGIKLDSMKLKAAADEILALRLPGVDTRVTVLGHIVRGGSPTAFDRLLGARLGHAALRALLAGRTGFMAGWAGPGCHGEVSAHDPYVVLPTLEEVAKETEKLLDGSAPLARWRKQIFADVEPMLRR